MLSHHEKPGWEDTATSFEGHHNHHYHQQPSSTTQQHQRTGSCDQVVPTSSPHSPPSSPLPLDHHRQAVTATAKTAAAEDLDSEDDHHRRHKQRPSSRSQGRSSVASDHGSGHSVSVSSARSAMQQQQQSEAVTRPRHKEAGSTRTQPTTMAGSNISSRPRFSLSTTVNPRPQVYMVGAATREAPKESSKQTTTSRSSPSRTIKESAGPRVTKSTTSSSNLGHAQPTTKSVSTTRILKSRSPTTITTTTTTTTRRVASTTITMGPHLDREHRKLSSANTASTANSGAPSTSKTTSSSRKERTTRASNTSPPTGKRAISRDGRRHIGPESTNCENAIVTVAITETSPAVMAVPEHEVTSQQNKDTTFNPASPTKCSSVIGPTATLLPALQMENEAELPPGIQCCQPAQETPSIAGATIDTTPKSLSPSPPPAPVLSSPVIVASLLQTPLPPQTAIPRNTLPEARQTPDTPTIISCSPLREITPIVQSQQEEEEQTEGCLSKPATATVLATPLCKSHGSSAANRSPGFVTKTPTVAVSSLDFLTGAPRIFRTLRDASPRISTRQHQQQQQKSKVSQHDIKAGDQERQAEVPTTPVPTTIRRSKAMGLIPAIEDPMVVTSSLSPTPPVASTSPAIVPAPTVPNTNHDEVSKTQPFRKNVWNGRMDSRFKPQSTATPAPEENAVPTTQRNSPARTGLLAAMGTSVSRAPLTKVKDPAVMLDLMTLMKERRTSRTLMCDSAPVKGASIPQPSSNQFRDRSWRMRMTSSDSGDGKTTNDNNQNDNDNDTTLSLTTNHNITNNNNHPTTSLVSSTRITLEDKKLYLKTQEMRRRSIQRRSSSLHDASAGFPLTSSSYPFAFPLANSPSPAALDSPSFDSATTGGFPWRDDRSQSRSALAPPIPAMSVTIPLKSLPLSFPDRLFQARSPSSPAFGSAASGMMPRSVSPRPVRATSITRAGSNMLPSLPSPALSLAVPQRHMSERSMDDYFQSRLSGSRSEDEQVSRHHTLRPFEKALVQKQQQQHQHQMLAPPQRTCSTWSGNSVVNPTSMSQLFPPLDDPVDATNHDSDTPPTEIDQQYLELEQHHHYDYQSSPQPTQDISFLTKRLANLQLMDSLCPVSDSVSSDTTLNNHPQAQAPEPTTMMTLDSAWAMQIQLLLTHLAEQTDLEQESRHRPLPPPPLPLPLSLTLGKRGEGVGLYKQVLTDWLLRLDQLASIPAESGTGSLYKEHPGLKREVEKIRWQHNVPSRAKALRLA
ncbi:hypothetical protein BGX23_002565 [Mortierella sp. AD031]|nr:hypothetical protein BGX23_002565 [Mortierella sp. AD031]